MGAAGISVMLCQQPFLLYLNKTASRRILKCCPVHLPPVLTQYKSGLLGRKYRRDVPKRCAVAAKRLCFRMQCVCPFGKRKIIVLGVRHRKIACCCIKSACNRHRFCVLRGNTLRTAFVSVRSRAFVFRASFRRCFAENAQSMHVF